MTSSMRKSSPTLLRAATSTKSALVRATGLSMSPKKLVSGIIPLIKCILTTTATDEHGNRNNVVHVKLATSYKTFNGTLNVKDMLDRKDSAIDRNAADPGPVPFVVVEKVEDEDQPEYGDVKSKSLSVDEAKRAADPEPDFEAIKKDSPLDTEALQKPLSPFAVAEDVDELEPPEAHAPLFRHESFQDSEDSLPEPAMDTIDEESARSSNDHTSSEDPINTPSAESQDDEQDVDELDHCPLLSHETGFADKASEFKKAPLFPHETGAGAEEEDEEEFDQGPLLPHEIGFTPQPKDIDDDYEEDEFDAAPLLPHETGFSSYRSSESTSKNGRFSKDEYDYEPEHYTRYGDHSDEDKGSGELDLAPTFSHEQDWHAEDDGEPLLPHERGSAAESFSGSERSFSMSPISYEGPSFAREPDTSKGLYGSMRGSFFRSRTSSSTLPNKLPRSDAEDINLHEPGLETFPVGRQQILERVATIGSKLPEDETHAAPGSPQSSVLSQACSSVDLAPVKSYISLASVREDEEEDEDSADLESIGSPVIMSHRSRRSRERDPLATPHPDDHKQLGFVPEEEPETLSSHTADSNGPNDVIKRYDSKNAGLKGLTDKVTSTATVMNTLTPPLTPRTLETLGKENAIPTPESELRQRRESTKEIDECPTPTPRSGDRDDEDGSVTDSSNAEPAAEKLAPGDGPSHWKGAAR